MALIHCCAGDRLTDRFRDAQAPVKRGQKTVVPLQRHSDKASNFPVNIGEPRHIARMRVCGQDRIRAEGIVGHSLAPSSQRRRSNGASGGFEFQFALSLKSRQA
jgi:hypothetical protein